MTSAKRGFTLLEVLLAFAIMAIALALMTEAQSKAVNAGAKALDLRDIRGAADTVFRKFIYEISQVNEGQTGTFDSMYADYIGLRGKEKDRWSVYRGVVHKKRGIAAGTDPTGKSEPLFPGQGSSGSGTSGSSASNGSGSGASGASGAASDTSTAEELYLLTLEVFQGTDSQDPVLTLHTAVPIPASELENEK